MNFKYIMPSEKSTVKGNRLYCHLCDILLSKNHWDRSVVTMWAKR